jgi:hypothetical protein
MEIKIIGAGLSGLIAGTIFPNAKIIESGSRHQLNHRALLRFRTDAVSNATGIEFEKVRVRKGIYNNRQFVQPTIQLANSYSRKVAGIFVDRSIWNTETVDRYIAPEDLIEQLINRCGNRISWDTKYDFNRINKDPVISTVPMNILAKQFSEEPIPKFNFSEVKVRRYRVQGCNVYQTIYYPDRALKVYRASITKDLLIVEYKEELTGMDVETVFDSFGIWDSPIEKIDDVNQQFGKITSIDEGWRRNFIYNLSKDLNIYSLGRFGTWRNILLDDIVHDCAVIKRLINSDAYSGNLVK